MRAFAAVTFLSALATMALASPTANKDITPRAVQDFEKSAELTISELEAQCDVLGCMTAFASQLTVCGIAIIEPTPVGEVACLIAIANSGLNKPASCNGCL